MHAAARILLTLLERQGLAVVLVAVGIAWVSGWMPFRLCDGQASMGQVIAAMERDRGQLVAALTEIAKAMTASAASAARQDARDAIKTCASITDKDARIACIQVAVTGK